MGTGAESVGGVNMDSGYEPVTLLISPFFDTATPSGGVLYSVDVVREWLRRGRQVTVLCSSCTRELGDLQPYIDEGQLTLHTVASFEQVRFTHHIHESVGRLAAKVIQDVHPDVIHVHNIHGMLAAVQAAIQSPSPVVFTALDFGLLCFNFYLNAGTPEPCEWPASSKSCADCVCRSLGGVAGVVGPRLSRAVTRRLWPRFAQLDQIQLASELQATMQNILRSLDVVIAPSPVMADQLGRCGVPRTCITHVGYGVTPEKIVRPAKTPSEILRFAFLGSAESVKGLSVLADAVAVLPDDLPLSVRAIGGEPVRAYLDKQPAQVKRYLCYTPALFGRPLAEEYTRIDAVLVPSIWHENSPFVALESLANGTPVIGSDVLGVSHLIIREHNGWLIEPGRSAAWTRAFVEAVQRPARIRRMQHNARFARTTRDFLDDVDELESALIARRRYAARPVDRFVRGRRASAIVNQV